MKSAALSALLTVQDYEAVCGLAAACNGGVDGGSLRRKAYVTAWPPSGQVAHRHRRSAIA
jgi:hypothetical protein